MNTGVIYQNKIVHVPREIYSTVLCLLDWIDNLEGKNRQNITVLDFEYNVHFINLKFICITRMVKNRNILVVRSWANYLNYLYFSNFTYKIVILIIITKTIINHRVAMKIKCGFVSKC